VYLGLGGNLGNAADALQQAVEELSLIEGITLVGVSQLYRTKPVGGPSDQPDYLNAVLAVDTILDPHFLLGICLSIEQKLGRVRRERWGSRAIDIDILLYGRRIINEPGLIVPHRMLRRRLFAMVPLADVAPTDFSLPPDGKQLKNLIEAAMKDPELAAQRPLTVVKTSIEIS
jgi:2-amino-4-hydroxy-6-hydroxymethyldihydropteridine diphosphokinase